MSENLKNDTAVHPADAAALALDRANSLLIVLMDLYEARGEAFVAGNPFIVHGMSAVNELLVEARNALTDLNEKYDLSVVAVKPAPLNTNIVELGAKPPEAAVAAAPVSVTAPKPALKPIAAAVVTLKEADEGIDKMIKSFRQL